MAGTNGNGQSELPWSPGTMEALTDAERLGEYTLERVRQLRPELINEVVRLRGQFIGQLRIAKILGVHHRTIAAIDQAYPERISDEKRRRVARLKSAADKLVELVDDHPESVPANVRCLAASQLIDKAELLSGGPTQRLDLELGPRIDFVAMYKDALAEMDRAADMRMQNEDGWVEAKIRAHAKIDQLSFILGCQQNPMDTMLPNGHRQTGVETEKILAISDAEEVPCS